VHLEHDPTANPPSGTNIEVLQKEKNTMGVEKRGRTAYLFVRRGWWVEGKMGVTKFSYRTNFDL